MRLTRIRFQVAALFAVFLSVGSVAMAHPGHALHVGAPESVAHYALHPGHSTFVLSTLIALASAWLFVRCVRVKCISRSRCTENRLLK